MKQLLSLFLFLVPCLAWAQYPSNGNQKITLGEQTTADGIIWRGVSSDTTLTAKSDTAAYFVLDTVNKKLYFYKASAIPKWNEISGSGGGGGVDSTAIKYVNTYGTQTVNGAKTFTTAPTFSTALLGGSGGTGITTFGAANRIPYAASTTALTTSANLTYTTAGGLSQLGTGEQYFTVGSTNNVFSGINFKSNSGNNTIFHNGTGTGVFGIGGGGQGQGANKIAAFYGGISIGTNYMNTAVPLNSMIVEGKVGFGTITSPSDILHIGAISGNVLLIQSTGFAEYLTLQNTSGTGLGIKFTDTNASKFLYYKEGKLSFGSGGQVPSTFTSWGNLSVGAEDVAAPTNGLRVMGGVRFATFAGGGTTTLSVDNNGDLARTSSIELKNNITNIKYGLNDILKLNPISFNWIDENKFGNINENGFVAEDVYTIIPNVVNSDANGIFMDYTKLIPILTKAIQEQQALIKALEQRIINLENK
jgi:hypothetical protein